MNNIRKAVFPTTGNNDQQKPGLIHLLLINAHVINGIPYSTIGAAVVASRSTIRRLETDGRRLLSIQFMQTECLPILENAFPTGENAPLWINPVLN